MFLICLSIKPSRVLIFGSAVEEERKVMWSDGTLICSALENSQPAQSWNQQETQRWAGRINKQAHE